MFLAETKGLTSIVDFWCLFSFKPPTPKGPEQTQEKVGVLNVIIFFLVRIFYGSLFVTYGMLHFL